MKNATLIEYLQARVKTLELDGRNLRANNATLSNNNKTCKEELKLVMDSATKVAIKYQDRINELEQQVANLKREKVAMQTR